MRSKQPPETFLKKGALRNFAKLTGKRLCQRLCFNKVARLRPADLLKKSLWHRCFPVNLAKFLRTAFSQNTFGRLLLEAPIYFNKKNVIALSGIVEIAFLS